MIKIEFEEVPRSLVKDDLPRNTVLKGIFRGVLGYWIFTFTNDITSYLILLKTIGNDICGDPKSSRYPFSVYTNIANDEPFTHYGTYPNSTLLVKK